ncbi:MAG: aromatic amino acid lyase, partial [Mangrovimonas sp.]|nr:aromatic amino acid lyase [Mangrovimonas sp.]
TRKLLDWAVVCSSAINEIVAAYDDHLSLELNQSKKHIGQRKIAEQMRAHLKDSKLTRKREHHLYKEVTEVSFFEDKVQEYYSIRCIPQILGPVLDTLNTTEKILVEE